MRSRCLVAAWILAVHLLPAHGALEEAAPVVVDGRPFLTVLGPHVSLLQDPKQGLTFEEVASLEMAGRFEPARAKVPSLGFTRDAVWLRFALESRSDREQTVVVELGMSRMSEWQWFFAGGKAGATISQEAGARFPTIEVNLPPHGACTVYARARSDTSVWLPLVAGSPAAFGSYAARRDFRDFAQAGFCLALVLMSLGLWAGRRRNRLYLQVALAMMGALLYQVLFNGLYAWLGGPFPTWAGRQGILISVLFFALMFARFTQDFLGKENLSRGGNKLFAAFYGLIIVVMALCVCLPYAAAVRLAQPVHLLAIAGAAAVSLRRALLMRGTSMGLFLAAWAVLLSGTVFFMLQLNVVVPLTPVSPYDTLIFVFSSVFLLFLLATANAQWAALRMETQVAALRQAESEARLAALRNQLDPHFLFNTLASIEELSHEAPGRIPSLIERLAAFLRRRLGPEAASADIALSEEIAAIRDYLAIEEVRFEKRLAASFEIASGAEDCQVPELVLLPLVENAITHGFAGVAHLELRISARLRAGSLHLRVENNGHLESGETHSRGTGTGLENLRNRLRLRYGGAASLSIHEERDTVVAEVVLPEGNGKP